jgi:hypothetical protein
VKHELTHTKKLNSSQVADRTKEDQSATYFRAKQHELYMHYTKHSLMLPRFLYPVYNRTDLMENIQIMLKVAHLIFSLFFFCNYMFWWKRGKGVKGTKERKNWTHIMIGWKNERNKGKGKEIKT